MIGIYKIVNKINHKVYIDQSKNVELRFKQHISELNKNHHINKYLQASWNKYGFENFEFIILKECSKEELNKLETFYWKQYKNNCYNLHRTGDAHNMTDEIKKKISQSEKGKHLSLETKEKLRQANLGKKQSEETIKKRFANIKNRTPWNKGIKWHQKKKRSEETRKKYSLAKKGKPSSFKGKHHTKEAIEKNRQAHLGKVPWNKGIPKTEEEKKKQSIRLKGRHFSPETEFKKGHIMSQEVREKISKTLKEKYKKGDLK